MPKVLLLDLRLQIGAACVRHDYPYYYEQLVRHDYSYYYELVIIVRTRAHMTADCQLGDHDRIEKRKFFSLKVTNRIF